MTNRKPFDIEAAKRGEPVVTRDGRKARFLAHDPSAKPEHQVFATVEDADGSSRCFAFFEDGKMFRTPCDIHDLFMDEPTIPEGYIRHDGGACPVDALEVEVINKKTGEHFVYSPKCVAWGYVSAYRVTKIKPAVPEPSVDEVIEEFATLLYFMSQGAGPTKYGLVQILNKFHASCKGD